MKKLSLFILILFTAGRLMAQIPCSLDNTFAGSGKLVSDVNWRGQHIVVQNDGKILVACNPEGNGSAYIKRFNVDGSVDNSYGAGGKINIAVAEIVTRITGMLMYNNQLFISGNTTTYIGGAATSPFAAGITANGTMLNSFGVNGVRTFPNIYKASSGIAADNAGNIYVAGYDWQQVMFVAKLNPSGNYDMSFDGDGIATLHTGNVNHSYRTAGIKIDKNNCVLVSGKKCETDIAPIPDFRSMMIVRFLPNGTPDNTFANNGIGLYNSNAAFMEQAQDIHVLGNNDYLLCGESYDAADYDYAVLKVKNNGIADASFGTAGWQIHDLEMSGESDNPVNSALLPDGRLLMSGRLIKADTVYFGMLMMKADGTRDVSFAPNGVFKNVFIGNNTNWSNGLGIDPTGKIVLAGHTQLCVNALCGPYNMAISRYNSSFAASGTNHIPLQQQISIYPNPAADGGMLVIDNPSGVKIKQVRVVNLNGQIQQVLNPDAPSFSFALRAGAGSYFCIIETDEGSITRKLMICE